MKAISLGLFIISACTSFRDDKPNDVNWMMMSKYHQYHQCYVESDTYGRRENLHLVYYFEILPDGTTRNRKVTKQEPKDPNFTTCFLEVMKPLKFKLPLSKDGILGKVTTKPGSGLVEVIQPFNFSAGKK